MGLFDFIKDLGQSKKEEKPSDATIQTSLNEDVKKAGLSINGFQLTYANGLATLSGVANSTKDLELARLIVGNHRFVSKVNDDGLKVASYPAGKGVPETPLVLAPQTDAAQMITVKPGDTLSKIAKQYLGNANRYPEIFEANRPMLKDPDAIFPGQVLRIPPDLHAH